MFGFKLIVSVELEWMRKFHTYEIDQTGEDSEECYYR